MRPRKTVLDVVKIDYPQDGEIVTSARYTFRVNAPENSGAAEVSIDSGPWIACRRDVGYWWHDWDGFTPGKHTLRARTLDNNGNETLSSLQRIRVQVPK